MFIRRQKEVSREFSEYIAKNVLNSQRVWRSIMGGTKSEQFRNILTRNIPLPSAAIGTIITQLQKHVGDVATHPLHRYTDVRLRLQVKLGGEEGMKEGRLKLNRFLLKTASLTYDTLNSFTLTYYPCLSLSLSHTHTHTISLSLSHSINQNHIAGDSHD